MRRTVNRAACRRFLILKTSMRLKWRWISRINMAARLRLSRWAARASRILRESLYRGLTTRLDYRRRARQAIRGNQLYHSCLSANSITILCCAAGRRLMATRHRLGHSVPKNSVSRRSHTLKNSLNLTARPLSRAGIWEWLAGNKCNCRRF